MNQGVQYDILKSLEGVQCLWVSCGLKRFRLWRIGAW
jgi:hypothetical protein